MISNLTISEINMFFTGDLIPTLKAGRYYVEKIKPKNTYQVSSMNNIMLGLIKGK